ncbi:hybrid sensor histidine kinase/response regulator [Hufsiella ginkgonis]|uniref:histidine kinase n=1 Tax=Hufsiella ginkgonis TaxID=2695274 RepID=A0A7K1XT35_9SPHI|nr:hybrid sensor histidine kinase/response regulator [Hufsiella ginkgonis]MXV13929.1 response regulator [Hufsiella ginkgonis]
MILIVDDKPENIFSLKKILELNNFRVDTANSGEEALKKILKNAYALIILDVQMPGMDGFEVAEAISGYSKAKDIPIIFLSAINTDKRFVTKGYASGGLDYVTKPVDPDILLLKVKTFYRLYEQTMELTQIQDTLREEIEFRKEAEKKKDEFISIASHELKTPLTSIKAYLQLSERSIHDGNSGTTRQYLQRTMVQLDKLNNLIADLLDISKIESGKLKFNKKHFDFEPLLNSAIDIIRQTHDGVRIILTGKANVQVFGDEVRIEQVLINYLTNAFKYSPGTKEVYVDVSTSPDNQLVVKVKDNGIGIPAEKQAGIFDKFYRVEETSHRFQGMGIGLYICAEILRRHNGTYQVESEEGKGSTFSFTLPISGVL